VREKRRVVILTQEFPHEGANLGVCVAYICCRYRVACRNLRPDYGNWADDGAGQFDIDCSDYHDQEEEILKIPPRQKEVEEVIYGPNQLG
jgi:hypothetical protein